MDGLKEVIDIVDSIQTLDCYSVWFWLSLAVPIFIAVVMRLVPLAEEDKKVNLKWVAIPLIVFFVLSVFIAMIGQYKKDEIRNLGWQLKNHMVHAGYYSMSFEEIYRANNDLDTNTIKKIIQAFPNEFSIGYSPAGVDSLVSAAPNNILLPKDSMDTDDTLMTEESQNTRGNRVSFDTTTLTHGLTVIISDTVVKAALMKRSVKILDAYLTNDKVLVAGNIKPFIELYRQNNLFTYSVIYKLIADSSERYSMNLDSTGNWGIVRRSYNPDKADLLHAYLTNDYVLSKGNMKTYADVSTASVLFTEDVINQMITKYPKEFEINLTNVTNPNAGLAVIRKK